MNTSQVVSINSAKSANARDALTRSGGRDMAVSSQWSSRPDDQRYLSLESLYERVKGTADASRVLTADTRGLRVQARSDDPAALQVLDDQGTVYNPSHWSFGQLCARVGAPAGYLRALPAALAGINLQYGLASYPQELLKLYSSGDGLRAVTSPDYGRVYDHQIVEAVQRCVAGTDWKVPGVIDWSQYRHNPHVNVTRDTTTLYASDRDVFIFLVDDLHPIEIGKCADGSPDLLFRGFYVWNSEVGANTFGLSTFYLRGVCQNRCLWGIEQQATIKLRHSKNAPARLASEIFPALQRFAQGDSRQVYAGVQTAKAAIVAKDDEKRLEFMAIQGFSKPEAKAIIATVLAEEEHPAESIWDFVQGITAYARSKPHQDQRIALETKAGKLLDKVTRVA